SSSDRSVRQTPALSAQSCNRGGSKWRRGCCTAPSPQRNYFTSPRGGSIARGRRPFPSAPQGALQERLHEFVGRAEKVCPAARVDIARIVARLEEVLTACVGVGRFRVQQVPDAECDLQILVDQPGVRAGEMEDAVRSDIGRPE